MAIGHDPATQALSRFASLIRRINWFSRVGQPLDPSISTHADDYLSSLGFPDITLTPIEFWEDAYSAAESLDLNNPAWEAEEQLRAVLSAQPRCGRGPHAAETHANAAREKRVLHLAA